MAGDNMESLLLKDDDSSSGESDSEVAVSNNAGATSRGVVSGTSGPQMGTPQQSQPQAGTLPTPMPPNLPTPTTVVQIPPPPAPGASQSEKAARLKSMYSPATKVNAQKQQQQATEQTQPPQGQAPPTHHQHHPMQSQQHSQAPTPANMTQGPIPGSSPYHRSTTGASTPMQQQQQQGMASHPGSQQMQYQRPGAAVTGTMPHPNTQQQHGQPIRHTSSGQKPIPHHASAPGMYSNSARSGVLQPGGTTGLSPANINSGVADPFEPNHVSATMDRTNAGRQSHQQLPPNQAMTAPQPSSAVLGSSSGRGSSGYHQGMMSANVQPVSSSSSNAPAPVPANVASSQARVPPSTSSSNSAAAAAAANRASQEKKYKERFLFFTRVLIKYLEQKDPKLHQEVKGIIKDCAERNRRQEPGFESVTKSMQKRLRQHVPDAYWKTAEQHFHSLLTKNNPNNSAGGMSAPAPGTGPPPGGSGTALAVTSGVPTQQPSNSANDERMRTQAQQRPNQPADFTQTSMTNAQQQQLDAKRRQSINRSIHGTSGQPQVSGPPVAIPATQAQTQANAVNTKVGKGRNSKVAPSSQPPPRSTMPVSTPTTLPAPKPQQVTMPMTSELVSQSAAPVPTETTPQSFVSTPAPVVRQTHLPPPPVREYSDFMQSIDHAAEYDWTVAGLLMEKEQPEFLSMEQKALLEDTKKTIPRATARAMAVPPSDLDVFPLPDWGTRNVLSARSAWVLLRGPEESYWNSRNKEQIGGSIKGLSPANGNQSKLGSYEHSWLNEQKAEDDKVLAMLSEGLQIYLRGVLEKAVHCARQRHNVDGIRLWHQQMTFAMKAKAIAKDSNKFGSADGDTGGELPIPPPPLTVRVGCDLSRQLAQATGNDAMTVKRMEEALANVPTGTNIFNADTETSCLLQASSMSELALLPKLAQAIDDADYSGKRNFEVYGGKHSSEPPLGRLPKQPKIEVVDFQMGMNFTPRNSRRCRATASSYFSY